MSKIDEKIDEKIVYNEIKYRVHIKLDNNIYKNIKPLFSCNGKCSYCIHNKCLKI